VVIALVSILPVKRFVGHTYQGFALFDRATNSYRPYEIEVGNVRVDELLPAILIIEAVFHLIAALSAWRVLTFFDYIDLQRKRMDPLRWHSFSLTYPLTTLAISLAVGVHEVTTLVNVCVAVAAACILCMSIDAIYYYLRTRTTASEGVVLVFDMFVTVYVPLLCVAAVMASVWATLVTYHAVSEEHTPSLVASSPPGNSDGGGSANMTTTIPVWAILCLYIGIFVQSVTVLGEILLYIPCLPPKRKFVKYGYVAMTTTFVGHATIATIIFFANLE
jgi:hypothetical protein